MSDTRYAPRHTPATDRLAADVVADQDRADAYAAGVMHAHADRVRALADGKRAAWELVTGAETWAGTELQDAADRHRARRRATRGAS